MESYVEVSFLNAWLILMLSFQVATSVTLQPIHSYKMYIYATVISFLSCILWNKGSIFIIITSEVFFFSVYFRYAIKMYLVALSFRFLCIISCFALFQGSFHNAAYFVPIQAPIYLLWMLYAIIFLLLKRKWKNILLKASYIYDCCLFMECGKLKLKGYLDSGNLLTKDGIPVIFITDRYRSYFEKQHIEWIVMKGIIDKSMLQCFVCELQLAGCQRHKVYVHCDANLSLPLQCDILLNLKAMTLG